MACDIDSSGLVSLAEFEWAVSESYLMLGGEALPMPNFDLEAFFGGMDADANDMVDIGELFRGNLDLAQPGVRFANAQYALAVNGYGACTPLTLNAPVSCRAGCEMFPVFCVLACAVRPQDSVGSLLAFP